MSERFTSPKSVLGRFEGEGGLVLSTVLVEDSKYETALSHPGLHGGLWVTLRTYGTAKAARRGHKRWLGVLASYPDVVAELNNPYSSLRVHLQKTGVLAPYLTVGDL
jgi:hypothetical protein